MATETVQASGTTTPNDWTLAAGASKQAAVNAPDDDATSNISSGTSSGTVQTFTCTPAALTTGDTITQIDIDIRARRGGGSNAGFVVGYSFTPNGGGTQTNESSTLNSTGSWADFAYQDTGLSVIWGSGLTIYCRNTQTRDVLISTLDITITYTPGGGGSTQPPRTMHQTRMRIQS